MGEDDFKEVIEDMTETWRRLLEMEKEEPDRSKKESSLRAPQETVAPEKEEWESSDARIEASAESPGGALYCEEGFRFPTSLVADFAKRIKKTMVEIRDLALSSRGKFKDAALGQEFYRRMADHIDNSDVNLGCFLDYLRINSPVRQTNMIHVILEESLEKHKKKLMDKGIKIFRKQFGKGLPNASVHIEELRFILNWVLEYVIISSAPNQSIAFLTRSLEDQEADGAMRSPRTRRVEIVIASGHYEDLSKQAEVPPEIRIDHGKSERSLILPLVDEIVQKNRGSLKLSEGRLRMVSLILPVERRKVVYYEQAVA